VTCRGRAQRQPPGVRYSAARRGKFLQGNIA
jgi:hypothetical protein